MLEDKRAVAVNDVILSCSDAADQYETASSIVEDEYLSGVFRGFAETRNRFALMLEKWMRKLGKLPISPDTEKEALESLWMRIKTTVKKNQEAVLLQEGIKLEKQIIDRCEQALKLELPAQLLQILKDLKQEADVRRKQMEKEIAQREAG